MIIKTLQIHAFGKFIDETYNLHDKIQVIYGLNEAGKSTLHAFIEAMFYGFLDPTKARKTYFSDYDRYEPIASERYGGAIIFNHQHKDYRLTRNLSKKRTSVTLIEEKTGKDITNTLDVDPATKLPDIAKFIDIPYLLYKNSLSVSQLKSKTEQDLKDELLRRIQNLTTTKTETISAQKALDTLDKQLKDIGSDTAPTRPFRQTLNQLETLKKEHQRTSDKLDSILEDKAQLETLKETLETFETQQTLLEKQYDHLRYQTIKTLDEQRNTLNATIKQLEPYKLYDKQEYASYIRHSQIIAMAEQNIHAESGDENLQESIAFKLDLIANLEDRHKTFIKKKKRWLYGSFLIVPLIIFLILNAKAKKLHKSIVSEKKELESAEKKHQHLQSMVVEKDKAQKELSRIETRYTIEDLSAFDTYINQHEAYLQAQRDLEFIERDINYHLGSDNIEELASTIDHSIELPSHLNQGQLKQQLEYKKDVIRKTVYDLTLLDQRINQQLDLLRPIETIEHDIVHTESNLNTLRHQRTMLEHAMTRIQAGVEKIEAHFAPALSEQIAHYLHVFTASNYNTIKVKKDLSFSVFVDEHKLLKNPDYFSSGTKDQIYFAMRLGILDTLKHQHTPLFLDDTFLAYDDERLKSVLKTLSTMNQRQIIIFTCQHREEAHLKTLKIPFERLTL